MSVEKSVATDSRPMTAVRRHEAVLADNLSGVAASNYLPLSVIRYLLYGKSCLVRENQNDSFHGRKSTSWVHALRG